MIWRVQLCFLALLVSTFAFSQKKIRGIVLDDFSSPIGEVSVSSPQFFESVLTDSNGVFEAWIPLDSLLVSFICKRNGYHDLEVVSFPVDSMPRLLKLYLSSNTVRIPMVSIGADYALSPRWLDDVDGYTINASKKNALIFLKNTHANTATNNARQIFAKIPGINIWENGNGGLQLNIGARGLNPNRTSNFNTRQNGYDISADALGYPESYYTPPSDAVERIEIIKGAASLQYGTQFGGLLNFKLKEPPKNKKIEFTTRHTGGMWHFYHTFNSLAGTIKKFSYYTFYQYKRGNGWRDFSAYQQHIGHIHLSFQVHKKVKLHVESTAMYYLTRQAGGLTDDDFDKNPRQVLRKRNWFSVRWNTLAFNIDYIISPMLRLNIRTFALFGLRNALGILTRIDRPDFQGNRDFLHDVYTNVGNESRLVYRYPILKDTSTLLVGMRIYGGNTQRQQGEGDNTDRPNFVYLRPDSLEGSNFLFPSFNVALFAENVFHIGKKISITPGIRYEYIQTASRGAYQLQNRDLAGNILLDSTIAENRNRKRHIVLMGLGLGYKPLPHLEIYANISQNYRAITFNDFRVNNPNLEIDPNLSDEKGFNADIGIRGVFKDRRIQFDISAFLLYYRGKIGLIQQRSNQGLGVVNFRTNLSDARSFGLESFIECDVLRLIKGKSFSWGLTLFSNLSIIDGRYINSSLSAIRNRKLELVPLVNTKLGATVGYKKFSATLQYTYLTQQFTDATNATRVPTAISGIIPAYGLLDFSTYYTYRTFRFELGINNMLDTRYFTRRADGYPGPGIIPADGIRFYGTLQIRFSNKQDWKFRK